MPGCIIWPATRQLPVYRAQRPTSILSVDKFMLCLCLVFRPFEILLLFFFVPSERQQKIEWRRSGYNLFYSRLARNSAVDGWTPIYPHRGVINVNGLVEVGACEWRPPGLSRCPPSPWPLPVYTPNAASTNWCLTTLISQLRYNFSSKKRRRMSIHVFF